MAGNEQMNWSEISLLAECPGQFKANERAQAVAEKSKRQVEVRLKRVGQRLHQRFHTGKKWLPPPVFSAGQLDYANFDARRKVIRPVAKN